jgi:hypothetical protein
MIALGHRARLPAALRRMRARPRSRPALSTPHPFGRPVRPPRRPVLPSAPGREPQHRNGGSRASRAAGQAQAKPSRPTSTDAGATLTSPTVPSGSRPGHAAPRPLARTWRPTRAERVCRQRASSRCRASRCAPPLRTTSTPTRARRRDGPRGGAADRHPRQLGHTNLGITSIYLQGIDSAEIIDTVHARRPPMVPVDAKLRL